jgi:hypothetical protein
MLNGFGYRHAFRDRPEVSEVEIDGIQQRAFAVEFLSGKFRRKKLLFVEAGQNRTANRPVIQATNLFGAGPCFGFAAVLELFADTFAARVISVNQPCIVAPK